MLIIAQVETYIRQVVDIIRSAQRTSRRIPSSTDAHCPVGPVHVAQRQLHSDVRSQRNPVNHIGTETDALTHGQRIELVIIEMSVGDRAFGGTSSSSHAE